MSKKISILLAIATMACGTFPTTAQQPPTVCQTDENFRAFNFWVGDWTVTDQTTGQLAGHNSIKQIEGGCALEERWKNTAGSTGRSLNYYNPVTRKWRQVWVATGAYTIDIIGGFNDGVMRMKGTIYYYGTNQSFPFTGAWTPNENGTVRQYFEQYDQENATWTPWFDGLYTKKQ